MSSHSRHEYLFKKFVIHGRNIASTSFDDDGLEEMSEQIEALRDRMLERKSPGSKLIISRLRTLDDVMIDLSDALDEFHPEDHHHRYAADQITRRYILLKSLYLKLYLQYVGEQIDRRISGFHLTDDNTQPTEDPEYMVHWRKSLRRQSLMEKRNRRAERAAPVKT